MNKKALTYYLKTVPQILQISSGSSSFEWSLLSNYVYRFIIKNNYTLNPKTSELIGRFSFKNDTGLGKYQIDYKISSKKVPETKKSFEIKLI